MLGRKVSIGSTCWQFTCHLRHQLKSFLRDEIVESPSDITLSACMSGSSLNSFEPLYDVYVNDRIVALALDQWQAFHQLMRELDIYLAEEVETHYLLHSGALVRDGKGVLLPGASGSGKSTLTLALAMQGYTYLSDELAAVHCNTGEVHPFPRPICLKDISNFPDLARNDKLWSTPSEHEPETLAFLQPEDIPNVTVGDSAQVGYVIFPQYRPEEKPCLTPLTPGETIEKLLTQSGNFRRFGGKGLDVLARLVENAECFSLDNNSLESGLDLINSAIPTRT